MFPAVERPGEAAAIGRNLKTKVWIGDHIDPWRGGRLSRAENGHIFAALRAEASQAIEELQIERRGRDRRRFGLRHALRRRRVGHGGLAHAIHLIGEVAAPGHQHDARHGR